MACYPRLNKDAFLISTTSIFSANQLFGKIGDQINVSFQCDDLVEAKGMFEALVEKRVQVSAHKSKQSAIDQKTGSTY